MLQNRSKHGAACRPSTVFPMHFYLALSFSPAEGFKGALLPQIKEE